MQALVPVMTTAVVFLSIGIALWGAATLWLAAGQMRIEHGKLELDQAASDRVRAQLQAQADDERQRMALVQAVIPAATALLGHWLGRTHGGHGHEDDLPPPGGPCRECLSVPRRPGPAYEPRSDDDLVSVDLGSLADLLSQALPRDLPADQAPDPTATAPQTPDEPSLDDASPSMA